MLLDPSRDDERFWEEAHLDGTNAFVCCGIQGPRKLIRLSFVWPYHQHVTGTFKLLHHVGFSNHLSPKCGTITCPLLSHLLRRQQRKLKSGQDSTRPTVSHEMPFCSLLVHCVPVAFLLVLNIFFAHCHPTSLADKALYFQLSALLLLS